MTAEVVEVRCWRCHRKVAEYSGDARHVRFTMTCPRCKAKNVVGANSDMAY